MSSSSAAAASESAADDITFPPTSAPAATVTSYMATEESRGNSGYSGNSGNSGNYGMDQGGSPSNAGGSGDNYRQTHGTCKYYPTMGDSKCQMQRSCYDCLNFNISTETYGCMINTVGVCTRLDGYDPALDFRLGHASNNETYFANYSNGSTSGSGESATVGDDGENEQYQFLASVATYCDQDDAECRSCIDNQFADVVYGNSGNSRSKYCYGQGGCVCVAICEALRLNPPHMDKECFANTMSANEKSQGTNYGSVFMIVGAMMMVVVVVLAIYRIRKRGELPQESEGGSGDSKDANAVNRRPSGADSPVITPENNASPIAVAMPVPTVTTKGTLLNLFNWAAMREVLIQHEQMRLEGIDEHALSPVDVDAKSDVQFLDVKPSAPEDDTEMPTAPAIPIVTVATAPPVMTVRAMASAPSAPDFDDLDDLDAADMTHL